MIDSGHNYSTKEETRSIKAEYSPFMCFSFSGIGSQGFILMVLSSKTFLFQERVPKMYDEETNKKQSNKQTNKQVFCFTSKTASQEHIASK